LTFSRISVKWLVYSCVKYTVVRHHIDSIVSSFIHKKNVVFLFISKMDQLWNLKLTSCGCEDPRACLFTFIYFFVLYLKFIWRVLRKIFLLLSIINVHQSYYHIKISLWMTSLLLKADTFFFFLFFTFFSLSNTISLLDRKFFRADFWWGYVDYCPFWLGCWSLRKYRVAWSLIISDRIKFGHLGSSKI